MPSILSDNDKQTVKRTVPNASNKIQAVAVARLYIAHPNRNRWTYTGLQGAAVLSNDLVGNTFWVKLVDISPANRGVIWDQEIYDTFQYNQDRTFFHSFELEQCLAGLSFMDEKEARTFKKKMDEREKNASKGTRGQPFGSNHAGGAMFNTNGSSGQSHGRFSNLLHRHRHSSNPTIPQPAQSITPQRQSVFDSVPTSRPVSSSEIDLTDPSWRPILDELLQMGITEDQIEDNADFIKQYVKQKQAEQIAGGIAEALPSANRAKAPPPPPPPSAPPARLSPQNTGLSTTSSRRGPPPAPPPSRRPVGGRPSSPSRAATPPRTPTPPTPETSPQPQFKVPPPLANAGQFAVTPVRALHPSGRDRASSGSFLPNPGPAPPPRPPKTPMEDDSPPQRFGVPPPFAGSRKPVPPPRGPIPPPPPSRDITSSGIPPPLPPKQSQSSAAHNIAPAAIPPPPPPGRSNAPPLPPQNARPIPPPPSVGNIPPPPPMPSFGGSGPPPPPPPLPSSGGPPPPPPPPPMPGAGAAPPLPKAAAVGRDGLLADIRGSGKGGLKKVPDAVKRDRSAAAMPGGEAAAPPSAGGASASASASAGGGGDAQGGLAGALAAALSQRKKKVSGSDDEKDDDDDW